MELAVTHLIPSAWEIKRRPIELFEAEDLALKPLGTL
jgi:hypothetical protein